MLKLDLRSRNFCGIINSVPRIYVQATVDAVIVDDYYDNW